MNKLADGMSRNPTANRKNGATGAATSSRGSRVLVMNQCTLTFTTLVALPYAIRRGVFVTSQSAGRPHPFLEPMQPHYRLGYAIAGLVLAHAWVSMSAGLATHVDAAGLYLATGAFVLVVLQVGIGLRLRARRG